MIRIADLRVPLSYNFDTLQYIASHKLQIESTRIKNIIIEKRAVNVVDKEDICFKMTLVVQVFGDENELITRFKRKNVSRDIELIYSMPTPTKLKKRPLVIGCGPAGLFAALILAQAGACPILLERGGDVDSRRQKVMNFWRTGVLDVNTNVQFGEGGAGTFSDGKLKIGKKDSRKMKVLRELVQAGAPPEIMYLSKPHIGTDRLSKTVKTIREQIISLGGEVRFNAHVTEILLHDGQVTGVMVHEKGSNMELAADNIVLAIGHSARDTFESLLLSGINIEQKAFAVGVRVEHLQTTIDKIQYGDFAAHEALGAADYQMVVHLQNGRNVYTFCMCPGGMVVAAASEENGLVTNGMSEFARNGRNANSALLVTVEKTDLKSDHPLAGVAFQREVEAAAFTAGGGNYNAPVQRLQDFLEKRNTVAFGNVTPTYLPGTTFAQVDSYLPEYIADSLRQAILEMGLWMPGFADPDAILTGAETRSSSPVRIVRDDGLQATGIKGLYPCGEGAGYAGGIISAAIDGVLCAESILNCNIINDELSV